MFSKDRIRNIVSQRSRTPPSGRSRARAPKTGDGVPVKATVPPWVRDAIDEAAIADGISRSGWVARELERIVTKKKKPRR